MVGCGEVRTASMNEVVLGWTFVENAVKCRVFDQSEYLIHALLLMRFVPHHILPEMQAQMMHQSIQRQSPQGIE